MNEQPWIVFETRPRTSDDRPFGPTIAGATTPEVRVEELSSADARALREPGRVVAPPVPLQLIRPVKVAPADGAAAAGTTWGVEAVGAASSPFSGSGVKVAVLDTGIDASHEAFAGVTVTQRDFTGEGDGDEDGHGTHCAGTIGGQDVGGQRIGVARDLDELLIGKVLGREGGSSDAIARAMVWALESGAHVISMSLGIDFPGLVARWTQQGIPVQPATSRALEAYRANLDLFEALGGYIAASAPFSSTAIVVAATGNESERDTYTIGVAPPAASEGFVAVGAVGRTPDGSLAVAPFSNTGPTVSAPGVDVLSARPGGGLASMSGTSMATPHVAGVTALWVQHLQQSTGRFDRQQVIAKLRGSSRQLPGLSPEDGGDGLVQAPQQG